MSLPRELLDDLLSRYMDGQLSGDELQRVEQLLASDEVARLRLADFRGQAGMIRAALNGGPKLNKQFAARVMAAAVAEAETEGLDANHPLRRMAGGKDMPGRRLATPAAADGVTRSHSRTAWIALATAASLAAIGFFLWTGGGDQPSDVALVPPAELSPTMTDRAGDRNEIDAQTRSADASVESLGAGSASRAELASADAADVEAVGDAGERIAMSEAADTSDTSTMTEPSLADVEAALAGGAAGQSNGEVDGQRGLQFVFVYEVQLTPEGIAQNVVGRVFEQVGLDPAVNRDVDETLVGYLRDAKLIGDTVANGGAASRANVLLLEGSGLKMEELMLTFLEQKEGVSRVGYGMLNDPPIMTAIENLQQDIDPRAVRQKDAGVVASRLVPGGSQQGARQAFAAGDRPFFEMKRSGTGRSEQLSNRKQQPENDITSQMLLIIRY